MKNNEAFRRLGMELPVFQAPIGSIASPELVAAVSNAGGLGQLACTWRSQEHAVDVLKRTSKLTPRAFGANFVIGFDFERALCLAIEHGVRCISFFWGDATRYVRRVHDASGIAIQVVGSTDEAKRAADAGFDIIVAQGHEAGGHVRGALGTLSLVPQVVDCVHSVPVVAAGGISDGRSVAAAFALGASGVWIGTAFLAASEADIHPVYRQRVFEAAGEDTVYSEVFDIGWPQAPLRTIRNSTVRRWEDAGRPAFGKRPGEGDVVGHRADGTPIPRYHFGSPTRTTTGDVEAMALYCGEGVGLVHNVHDAAHILSELALGIPAPVLEAFRNNSEGLLAS
jgi:nitronate monooxygenase